MKHYLKAEIKEQNPYLDHLVDPSFQGINRTFVFSFDVDAHSLKHTGYFVPKVKLGIKIPWLTLIDPLKMI